MNKHTHLYGLTVTGIQPYIFQSNRLIEIIGGSEIVEQLCTTLFRQFISQANSVISGDIIRTAAGNIRFLTNKVDAERLYCEYPEFLEQYISGVSFSQAVVEYIGDYKAAKEKLDIALASQRNVPLYSSDANIIARARAPRTGGAALYYHKWDKKMDKPDDEYFDAILHAKHYAERYNPKNSKNKQHRNTTLDHKASIPEAYASYSYPTEFSHISTGGSKSWLAVVHADGNGMGKRLKELEQKYAGDGLAEKLKVFSKKIEQATLGAYNKALKTVVLDEQVLESCADVKDPNEKGDKYLHIRPLVMGGDDFTFIIRADLAIKFTTVYLDAFEKESATLLEELKLEGLTACAGIAFVKEKFPFHYAAHLAEDLCRYAKDKTERKASAFQFHLVRDSFLEDYEGIVEREIKSFEYGPYLIGGNDNSSIQCPTEKELQGHLDLLNREDAPVNGIREWLATSFTDLNMANELKRRILQNIPRELPDLYDLIHKNEKSLLMTMAAHTVKVTDK